MGFEQLAGKSFTVTLQPPPNTLARVCLPTLGSSAKTLDVDGKAVAASVQGDYLCVHSIGSAAGGVARRIGIVNQ